MTAAAMNSHFLAGLLIGMPLGALLLIALIWFADRQIRRRHGDDI